MRPAVSIGGFDSGYFDETYPGPADHHPPHFSDDDLSRLFDGDSSHEPNLSFLEGGLPLDLLSGEDFSAFGVDSLVDFDPECGGLESKVGLSDGVSRDTARMQASYGASA